MRHGFKIHKKSRCTIATTLKEHKIAQTSKELLKSARNEQKKDAYLA